MYVRFELTDTNMEFKVKDEAGADIETHTFAVADYTLQVAATELVVYPSTQPEGTFPPAFSVSRERVVFINSTTGPFQTDNEGAGEA